MDVILVGVDGSTASLAAFRWALDAAKIREADIEAVYAYDPTPAWALYGYIEGAIAPPVEDEVSEDEAQRRAEEHLAAIINEATAHDPLHGVAIRAVAVKSLRPSMALVERSEGKIMTVVGSRGRGGFAGLLLGSVSQQVLQHAKGPVMVLSAPKDAESKPEAQLA